MSLSWDAVIFSCSQDGLEDDRDDRDQLDDNLELDRDGRQSESLFCPCSVSWYRPSSSSTVSR